jgi:hypothetical protein
VEGSTNKLGFNEIYTELQKEVVSGYLIEIRIGAIVYFVGWKRIHQIF